MELFQMLIIKRYQRVFHRHCVKVFYPALITLLLNINGILVQHVVLVQVNSKNQNSKSNLSYVSLELEVEMGVFSSCPPGPSFTAIAENPYPL